LSLDQIDKILGKSPSAVMDTVARHIEMLENEIDEKKRIIQRLNTAKEILKLKAEVNVTKIIEAIRDVSIFDGCLSEGELISLAIHDAELLNQGSGDFATRANELITLFRTEMKKGTPFSSPAVQKLITKWAELAELITGGNADMKDRIKRMMQANARVADQLANDAGLDKELLNYMKSAAEVLKGVQAQ
jgi:hypothetical protein